MFASDGLAEAEWAHSGTALLEQLEVDPSACTDTDADADTDVDVGAAE